MTAGGWAVQSGYDVRFDWGAQGIARLAPHVDTIVVVDVLRFTTAVDTAVGAGARVYPFRWRDKSAPAFAAEVGAVIVDEPGGGLCPASLRALSPGDRVVIPSPNGSTCALLADEAGVVVAAACLRNAPAVAEWVTARGGVTGVVACGEFWEGGLRPAIEDLLGAAAVLGALPGSRSPEADAAIGAFPAAPSDLPRILTQCASGLELAEKGHLDDVEWAAQFAVSASVPVLADGSFAPA